MYEIDIAPAAREDLRGLRKIDQARAVEAIEEQLRHQPDVQTHNRKRLRAGHVTEWELRAGDIRIFDDVDVNAKVVNVVAVGRKKGNKLFLRGQEYSP